jgi:DNA-binding PadR family transcriptional regulator
MGRMSTYNEIMKSKSNDNDDRIRLTELERVLLIALLKGKMTKYELARQMEEDNDEYVRFSNGTIYPALKRMISAGMVGELDAIVRQKPGNVYTITSIGKEFLSYSILELQEQIQRAKERSRT